MERRNKKSRPKWMGLEAVMMMMMMRYGCGVRWSRADLEHKQRIGVSNDFTNLISADMDG